MLEIFGCLSRAKLIGKAIAGEEIRLITTPIMNIFQKVRPSSPSTPILKPWAPPS
jgi:hypothetical protein